MTTTTATTATEKVVVWRHDAAGHPDSIWMLDDGRIMARRGAAEEIYDSATALRDAYPHYDDHLGALVTVEAPPLPATYTVDVDWAAIDHAMAEVDRARRGTMIGSLPGGGDAFGGTYMGRERRRSLARLVELAAAIGTIAKQAWEVVHQAPITEDVEGARQACRVAIACSHAFSLLHAAELIGDPATRICGTGEGYGLSGLRRLAGYSVDEALTRAQVEAFAAGASTEVLR